MKTKARLKITLSCNKLCEYCINKNAEYRNHWTEIDDIHIVNWNAYRSIIVSGGEPTLHNNLPALLRDLRVATDAPIYLQTNGARLTKSLVECIDKFIDGVGYSIHDVHEFEHLQTRLLDIARIKPIRLYINKETYDNFDFEQKVNRQYFALKVWQDGDFDLTEHIYLLKEKAK